MGDDGERLRAEIESLEGLLRVRARLEAHERTAVEALRADSEWPSALGERLVAAAREAIRGPGVVAALTLKIKAFGARIEALIGTGRLLEPALVRGDAPGGLLIEHALGELAVSTHVDVDVDRFVVMMDLGRESAAACTRLTLLRAGRELASEVPGSGRWVLPRLGPGAYRITARRDGGAVAELDLVLERSAD